MGQEGARANQPTGDLNDTVVSLEVSAPSSPGFPSLTNLEAICLVWDKTKFSGQLTACWHLPRKGGAPGLVPVPPASLIYRGEMPPATAPRRAGRFLWKPRSLLTLCTGKPASSWTGRERMEATVLMALANQSHTVKPQE